MLDIFGKYLSEVGNLSAGEVDRILSGSIPKRLQKRQMLLKAGDVCRYNAFVSIGCLRAYRIGADGSDHVCGFAAENAWINEPVSLLTGSPAVCSIEAIEASEVVLLSNENFQLFQKEISRFFLLQESLRINFLRDNQNRVFGLLSNCAEENYRNFVKAFPQLQNRVPLHMIAAYLGVARETLTRLRAEEQKPQSFS